MISDRSSSLSLRRALVVHMSLNQLIILKFPFQGFLVLGSGQCGDIRPVVELVDRMLTVQPSNPNMGVVKPINWTTWTLVRECV